MNATAEKSVRRQQVEARRARVAKLIPKTPRVRVVPRDDKIREAIKHPTGIKFGADGAAEWPFDQFTKRRLRDGDITIEEKREPTHARDPRPRARTHVNHAQEHEPEQPKEPTPEA